MIGTMFGVAALVAGLVCVSVSLWLLAGSWGLLAAGGLLLACGVVTVRMEVLYARTD